jgi:hypothetical protein
MKDGTNTCRSKSLVIPKLDITLFCVCVVRADEILKAQNIQERILNQLSFFFVLVRRTVKKFRIVLPVQ